MAICQNSDYWGCRLAPVFRTIQLNAELMRTAAPGRRAWERSGRRRRLPHSRRRGYVSTAAWPRAALPRPSRRRRHRTTATLDAGQLLAVELPRHCIPCAHSAHAPLAGRVTHRPLMPLFPGHRRHRRHWCWCRSGRRGAARNPCSAAGRRPRGGLRRHRRGDRKSRSDRDATQEMLHASVLYGCSGLHNTLQMLAPPEGSPRGPRVGNNRVAVSFPRTRNFRRHVSDLTGCR